MGSTKEEIVESALDLQSDLETANKKLTDLKLKIKEIAHRLKHTDSGDAFSLDQIETDLWALT